MAHMLLVRHGACSEHGELVHAGDTGAERPPARGVREGSAPEADADDAQAGSHCHDHCWVAAHRQSSIMRHGSCILLPSFEPCLDAAVEPEQVALRPPAFALYLLAPKHSPPHTSG